MGTDPRIPVIMHMLEEASYPFDQSLWGVTFPGRVLDISLRTTAECIARALDADPACREQDAGNVTDPTLAALTEAYASRRVQNMLNPEELAKVQEAIRTTRQARVAVGVSRESAESDKAYATAALIALGHNIEAKANL